VAVEERASGSRDGRQKEQKKVRKKPGPARTYEHRFPVRANNAEYNLLAKRAKAAGYSLSRYLVECGLKAPDPPPPKELDPRQREMRERALFELRMVARNLNQITQKIHQNSTMSEREVLRAIKDLHLRVDQMVETFEGE
jgi:hypothetical protein